jgi:adenylosuccinate synthase
MKYGGMWSDLMVMCAVQLEDGKEINLLPYGIQKEFRTKCLVGNGVTIDPRVLLSDFKYLKNNGVDYEKKTIISER